MRCSVWLHDLSDVPDELSARHADLARLDDKRLWHLGKLILLDGNMRSLFLALFLS